MSSLDKPGTFRRKGRHGALRRLFFFLATIAMLSASCTSKVERPDILLITVDTLRPDHMSLYGYHRESTPNIDRWFAGGVRFDRCYSTEANTPQSVVSILSGEYPQDHGVRLLYQLLAENFPIITERLPDEYQTAAFVANIVLTNEALGIASRFDHYDDFVEDREPYRNVYERTAERTTDAALLWLVGERDPDRPLFLWIHYIDPHGPYHPPEDWKFSFTHEDSVTVDLSRMKTYQIEPGIIDGLTYVDRYDEEIAYLDTHVGRLLEGYAKAAADPESSYIIFTADHGESMMEHEKWFTHGYHVYDEIVRVPLMFRGPGLAPDVRKDLVSGVDVTPTILGFAGPGAGDVAGVDLFRPGGVPAGRTVFSEASQKRWQLRAAVQGDAKWVAIIPRGTRTVEGAGVYDLAADPGELQIQRADDRRAGALDELLRRVESDPDPGGMPVELQKGIRITAPKVAPRADAEALERLRSLGYVN